MYPGDRVDKNIERQIKHLLWQVPQTSLSERREYVQRLKEQGQLDYTHAGFLKGNTLLNYAVDKKEVALAHLLLEAGANPVLKNNYGDNALSLILRNYYHHYKSVKGVSLEVDSWDVGKKEHFDLIEKMIEQNKAVLNDDLSDARRPLHLVANVEFYPLFLLLVSKGADFKCAHSPRVTPLQSLQDSFHKAGRDQPTEESIQQAVDKMTQDKALKAEVEVSPFASGPRLG